MPQMYVCVHSGQEEQEEGTGLPLHDRKTSAKDKEPKANPRTGMRERRDI